MRAHFGLPSVVGELNEGKVPRLTVMFYKNSYIEPPESFVALILILSSRPSMSSLRSLTSPPQASRSAFDYNLPIGICTIHENLCLRSAT